VVRTARPQIHVGGHDLAAFRPPPLPHALGSVKQAHKVGRDASNSREMTKSLVCSDIVSLLFDNDHPMHAEFVGEHAEA
jgi:hypothetical protein